MKKIILVLLMLVLSVTAVAQSDLNELERNFYLNFLNNPAYKSLTIGELASLFYTDVVNANNPAGPQTFGTNVLTVAPSGAQYTTVQAAVDAAYAAQAGDTTKQYVVMVSPGVAMTYTPAAGVTVVSSVLPGVPGVTATIPTAGQTILSGGNLSTAIAGIGADTTFYIGPGTYALAPASTPHNVTLIAMYPGTVVLNMTAWNDTTHTVACQDLTLNISASVATGPMTLTRCITACAGDFATTTSLTVRYGLLSCVGWLSTGIFDCQYAVLSVAPATQTVETALLSMTAVEAAYTATDLHLKTRLSQGILASHHVIVSNCPIANVRNISVGTGYVGTGTAPLTFTNNCNLYPYYPLCITLNVGSSMPTETAVITGNTYKGGNGSTYSAMDVEFMIYTLGPCDQYSGTYVDQATVPPGTFHVTSDVPHLLTLGPSTAHGTGMANVLPSNSAGTKYVSVYGGILPNVTFSDASIGGYGGGTSVPAWFAWNAACVDAVMVESKSYCLIVAHSANPTAANCLPKAALDATDWISVDGLCNQMGDNEGVTAYSTTFVSGGGSLTNAYDMYFMGWNSDVNPVNWAVQLGP